MPSIAVFARWDAVFLVGGFALVVSWKLLTSRASLRALLEGDRFDGNTVAFSPGRAQLLTVTVLFAVYYLIQILHNPTGFPPVPRTLLYVLGGSQVTYLGGKAYDIVLGQMLHDFKSDWSKP